MKKTIFFLGLLFLRFALCAQFTTIEINKPLKDFPDMYDLTTPLNAGVTCAYIMANGTDTLWRYVSTFSNPLRHEKGMISNSVVDEETKNILLNRTIKEVMIYKDSVACVITKSKRNNSDFYYIRNLFFENGKWLNAFEDGRSNLEESHEYFYTYAPDYLIKLRRSSIVQTVSTDTLSFINYVKQYGVAPKEFLLEKLANYPLVIYGEIHRRKVSWDLLSSLLSDPRFTETTGTIFLEQPAYQQDEFDSFFASTELDTAIILDILGSSMVDGKWDRGEYEFLVNLWKLNQTLPAEKQIRIIPVDEQIPWKFCKTPEDFEKFDATLIDRNTRMADMVEHTLNTKTDTRNCLFVVGYGHARKSLVPGGYSSAQGEEPALTAGAQLVQRLSDKNIFVVIQHGPMMRNVGGAVCLVRQGLFDYVFEKTGNQSIAFNLSGN